MLLVARLEPHYLDQGFKSEIPAKTYFHLWMVAAHIIGNGREAYLAAMTDPLSVKEPLSVMTTETGLYLMSIFRFEQMTFEAQKLRLITAIAPPHDEEAKRRFATSTEGFTKTEKTFNEIGQVMSGFFCVMPTIRENFKGPGFDHGFPELYPSFEQLDSGAVVVRAYKKPPPGSTLPGTEAAQPAE